ncbi:MAG TPA: c-type cytochrome biogenesis protein CcmI [Candidatus Binataceae bacterium]|nr:c-type cytochrome biogenesis protein CcmI [Candidatus Binataceae bacterium]
MTVWIAAILIVIAVAMFVAAPLTEGLFGRRFSSDRDESERFEHQRSLALQGLRELEFDRAMGKLDDLDYQNLKRSLEQSALAAMSALEKAGTPGPSLRLASRRARSAAMPRTSAAASHGPVNFCPQCGTRAGLGHNFCANCGAAFAPDAYAAGRGE